MTTAEKLVQIAENEQKIYDKGFEDGKVQGGGGDNWYDTFWDTYQANGNRENYGFAFAGHGWTDETFKPEYDMRVTSGSYMFHSCKITNLKAILEKQGVTLDFSNSTNLTYLFNGSSVSDVGVVDARSCPDLNYCFYAAKLVNIEKFIVNENNVFRGCFTGTSRIVEIRFEGNISSNLSISTNTGLSHDSLMSIIEHLADKSDDTSGTELVLTIGSTNIEKLTEEELEVARQKGWQVN